ncbi:TonB-dependent SusC/RagA subfamily outer membrane receptor [Flavobacterium chryseum]|nr:TonB-dependent SusC/RagA subfamily outer membrane receptor [Flavobacterium sp. P3160]
MKSLKLISLAITMLICFVTAAQEKTITGIISDETTLPIPGVTITNQNSKATAITNFSGEYSIQAVKGDLLIYSFIGYKTQRQKVENSNIINIKLYPENQTLNEVVVVGYGTSNSEYEDRSYARVEKRKEKKDISQALKGKVSGVQVQNNIGYMSNPSPIVTIRGVNSVSQKNEPMYIVDGVDAKANQMAKINPSDIQDLKVLKDDAATSIYGSKASNGVVIISTKNELYKNLTEKELDKKLNIITPIPAEPTQEDYDTFVENAFESPKTAPLSTFSIDVDNASYTNIRRFINNGQEVPKDAVRVEEMVNFFKYNYPQPKDEHPFSINTEVSYSPWNSKNQILRIGIQGKNIPTDDLPASNLVFLIDVSGSMGEVNKLPLLQQSMKILVNELRAKDKVAIVVYAGAAGLVLPPTSGGEKKTIIAALDNLQAGGSTA